ncbi:MAG TPA: crossover junction endodeoxyribonuclease RuvC [Pseudohaliea sp.]|nr:crossover junction endodeoxyribonuclease RuvC [Pseudohaliea sp.]
MRILGLDPGLRRTGWGVIESVRGRLRPVACGTVASADGAPLAERLVALHDGLSAVIAEYGPQTAAVEETFVNRNPTSTLRLGTARGVALLVPALAGLPVAEYGANHIKKAVVGAGHAGKEQVQAMVLRLLPGLGAVGSDAADALAVAICHAHHCETQAAVAAGQRADLSAMAAGMAVRRRSSR